MKIEQGVQIEYFAFEPLKKKYNDLWSIWKHNFI